MDLITSQIEVSCETFDTTATAKMHEAKEKRKLELSIKDKEGHEMKLSLFKEDVRLFAEFIFNISEYLDKKI